MVSIQNVITFYAMFAVTQGTASGVRGTTESPPLMNGGLNYSQVIAQFPPNVWDSSDCSISTLRALPEKCSDALTPSSTDEEKLACNIISQPFTQGILPFGMYPTSLSVAVELDQVRQATLTQVFSACALAQMIDDGCFNFQARDSNQKQTTEYYSSKDEYTKIAESEYGISVEVSGGFGPLTVKAGYSKTTSDKSSFSTITQSFSAKKVWEQVIGRLSIDTCARSKSIAKYLNPDYIKLWNDISTIDSKTELMEHQSFKTLMTKGFHIPTSFEYAIRYSANIDGSYSQSIHEQDHSIEEAVTASVSVSFAGASAGISTKMKTALEDKLKNTKTTSSTKAMDSAYGDCDFYNMFLTSTSWMEVLRKCAEATKNDLTKLDRPSRVMNGGFYNIASVLDVIGYFDKNNLKKDMLYATMNDYLGECFCIIQEDHWMFQVRFGRHCLRVDGSSLAFDYNGIFIMKDDQEYYRCKASRWPFANDLFAMNRIPGPIIAK